MKKQAVFFLFFLACFPLFSQSFREARIFVPPVSGIGSQETKAIFHQKITYEVVLQHYWLASSLRRSEYILSGTIMPLEQFTAIQQELEEAEKSAFMGPTPARPIPPIRNTRERREFFSWDIDNQLLFFDTTGEDNYEPNTQRQPPNQGSTYNLKTPQAGDYVFAAELIHRLNGNVLSRGHIYFLEADDSANEDLAVVLYNMFSVLPEIEINDDWRNNWLFLEVGVMWLPRIYSNESTSLYFSNFGFRMAADFHLLNFMSLSAGIHYTQDWIIVTGTSEESNIDIILEVPLALKLVFKPGESIMLEPYGGISYNHSMYMVTEPSPFSWFAGLQFGVKAGPGLIYFDSRFAQDFSASSMGKVEYNRHMVQIGTGYKFGIMRKMPVVRAY